MPRGPHLSIGSDHDRHIQSRIHPCSAIVRPVSGTDQPVLQKLIQAMQVYPVFQTSTAIKARRLHHAPSVANPLEAVVGHLIPRQPLPVTEEVSQPAFGRVIASWTFKRSVLRPVTDWERHPEGGNAARRDGGAGDNKSAHLIATAFRSQRELPSEGWVCGPSNPHIRLFNWVPHDQRKRSARLSWGASLHRCPTVTFALSR